MSIINNSSYNNNIRQLSEKYNEFASEIAILNSQINNNFSELEKLNTNIISNENNIKNNLQLNIILNYFKEINDKIKILYSKKK